MVRRRHVLRMKTKRLLMIVLPIFIILAFIMIIITRSGEGTADTGYISVNCEYDGVIVRSEKAVAAGSFDRADYFVSEGEHIAAGAHVMDIYMRGYNDELMLSLQQTEREIYDAQLEQLGEARDSVLNGYNELIGYLESDIADAVMFGKTDALASLEDQLKTAMTERSEYLRTTLQETEKLRALYKTKQEKEELIGTWRSSLTSEFSGTVSFYFDDYENALNEDKLSIISSDLVSSAKSGKGKVGWTTKTEELAYRVVDTTHWYCVYLTSLNEALRTTSGMSYTVAIEGFGEYTATALEPVISGKNVVNILRIDHEIGELINVRSAKIHVRYDASGIEVDTDGIQIDTDDAGKRYLELLYRDGRKKVEIDVLASDGKNAVVIVKGEDDQPIVAGVRYWIKGQTVPELVKGLIRKLHR